MRAASVLWIRLTWGSCMERASTTSTDTIGRWCGLPRRPAGRAGADEDVLEPNLITWPGLSAHVRRGEQGHPSRTKDLGEAIKLCSPSDYCTAAATLVCVICLVRRGRGLTLASEWFSSAASSRELPGTGVSPARWSNRSLLSRKTSGPACRSWVAATKMPMLWEGLSAI